MSDQGPGGQPTGKDPWEGDAGLGGVLVRDSNWFVRTFGRAGAGFAVTMVAIGCAFVADSIANRLDEPPLIWGTGEFLAVLGFGTLLVVLGCLDRLLAARGPSTQGPPPRARALPGATPAPLAARTKGPGTT